MENSLPLKEIRDRISYRQEPQIILSDLIKRGLLTEEDSPSVLKMIEKMKKEADFERMGWDGC
jgi:hypothetical protein